MRLQDTARDDVDNEKTEGKKKKDKVTASPPQVKQVRGLDDCLFFGLCAVLVMGKGSGCGGDCFIIKCG